MSFDLRLSSGDLSINSSQDLDIVVDHDKLAQDVIKIITTKQGSNKFQPQIGSLLHKNIVGKTINLQNSVSIIESSVREAVTMLQRLQKQQMQFQALSPSETIISIDDVQVRRDSIEPRQLNVALKLTSGNGNRIAENFTIRIM